MIASPARTLELSLCCDVAFVDFNQDGSAPAQVKRFWQKVPLYESPASIGLRLRAEISSTTQARRIPMFFVILALIGTGGIFFLASATQYSGWYWSYQLCQQGAIFCEHPSWILIAAGAMLLFEMVRTMSRA
jgi:hypothetical protein